MKQTPYLAILLPIFGLSCGGADIAPQAPPWLEPQVESTAKQGAPGTERVGDFYRGVAYEEDERTDWRVTLDATNCYWFTGGGDHGVKRLYLYLWDPSDSRVADFKEDSANPVMSYCPEKSGMFRLQAKVTEGTGHYRVGIYAKSAPPKAAPPPPPAPVDLGKLVDAEAAAAAPGASRVGEHFSGSVEKSDWYTALEAGSCYWFIGVGGEGVKELYLYLWDPATKRIADNRADGPKSVIGHCATTSGMYHVQAKVNSGDGPYKVGVFQKKK